MMQLKYELKSKTVSRLMLTVLGCLLIGVTVAQPPKLSRNYKISSGSEYKWQEAIDTYYLEKDDDLIIVKETVKGAMFIEKNNLKNLSQVSSKELTLPKDAVLEEVMMINGKGYVFYSSWNKDKGQEQLFYKLVDFKKGDVEPKEVKIITVKGKLAGDMGKQGGAFSYNLEVVNKFDFYKSYDEKIMMISCRMKPEKRNDSQSHDRLGFYVFNTEGDALSEVWNNMIRMPYTEEQMDVMDYGVDGKGTLYIAAKIFNSGAKDKSKDGSINYHVEMLRMNKDDKELVKTPMDLGDKFFASLKLFENPEGYMYCIGFYNKGTKKKGKEKFSAYGYYYMSDRPKKAAAKLISPSKVSNTASGLYTFKIKSDGDLYDSHVYDIPLDVINQYLSAKSAKKNKEEEEEDGGGEIKNLVLDRLVVDTDGSITVLCEQFSVLEKKDSKGRPIFLYYYNDILVTKINADGNLAYMKKLPKRQKAGAGDKTDQIGYYFDNLLDPDNYYFIFLDNIKNQEIATDEVPAQHIAGAGGYLVAYKMNKMTGDVSKEAIADTRNVNGTVMENIKVTQIVRNSKNELVGEVKRKKSGVLYKMNIIPAKK